MSRRRSAFSLIELVIVVLVIGILAGVAAPRYSQALRWQRLEAASRQIAADLGRARDEAVRRSTPRTVEFRVAENEYTLLGVSAPDRPSQPFRVDLSQTGYPTQLSEVNFGGSSSVTFNVYGHADNRGTITITSGGESRTIDVSLSGQTRVTGG